MTVSPVLAGPNSHGVQRPRGWQGTLEGLGVMVPFVSTSLTVSLASFIKPVAPVHACSPSQEIGSRGWVRRAHGHRAHPSSGDAGSDSHTWLRGPERNERPQVRGRRHCTRQRSQGSEEGQAGAHPQGESGKFPGLYVYTRDWGGGNNPGYPTGRHASMSSRSWWLSRADRRAVGILIRCNRNNRIPKR